MLNAVQGYSTHNRAGEITYCHISGLTYGITITTYTRTSSCQADRCELEVHFGDGTLDTIQRVNGSPCTTCGQCNNCGEEIAPDIKKNIYYTEHTYSGIGTYVLHLEDPNRNANIDNIPSSVNVTFYIESQLVIFPGLGDNCSPVLSNPPIDNGCQGAPYLHNPGAVDPDGDSLVYSLVPSLGLEGNVIDGYVFPNEIPGCENNSNLSIDPVTGTLTWDAPQCAGQYNVAIRIEEYRNGQKVGEVVRDMQIDILGNCPNDPPQITLTTPQCLIAGDLLTTTILAEDPNAGEIISLTASGEPLELASNQALFNPVSGISPITANLLWQTNCNHIKKDPYLINFKAEDDNSIISLVDFETMEIQVIAPANTLNQVTPIGSSFQLDFSTAPCDQAIGYKVYRRIDSSGYVPSGCETGVDSSLGFTLVGNTLSGVDTLFVDSSQNLLQGQKFCYLTTACYPDGSESQASNEVCSALKRDVPIITHVSVFQTDQNAGKDSVIWTNPTELDTNIILPPYTYKVYRKEGVNLADQLVYTSSNFSDFNLADTVFIDSNINTKDTAHSYRIELLGQNQSVGFSSNASSIFLQISATDEQLNLSWIDQTPWTNHQYIVYKQTANSTFAPIDTVTDAESSDLGLINDSTYCYYIKSIGTYSLEGIDSPLVNNSQIACASPFDNVAPCPVLIKDSLEDCEAFFTQIQIGLSDSICNEDAAYFRTYATFIENRDFTIIQDSFLLSDSILNFVDSTSIAACYYFTVLDSNMNESSPSDTVCFENCPIYTLPNVFTPSIDGFNDLFRPMQKRFVERIRMRIYNRWGERVFKTNNPDILWDGVHYQSLKNCTEGVYYYTCDVFFITLLGLEKVVLNGTVTLLRTGQKNPSN